MTDDVMIDENDATETKRGRPPKSTVAKATKPGFRPASRLGYLKAPPGYTARWVSADPDNIARKKAEGWVLMRKEQNKGESLEVLDVNDGSAIDSTIKYRDVVAMMLPDDIKQSRTEYYQGESRKAMQMVMKKADTEGSQMGVQTYKPKGMSGRIVID